MAQNATPTGWSSVTTSEPPNNEKVIRGWLSENCDGAYEITTTIASIGQLRGNKKRIVIQFEKDDDLALFKLRF